MSNCSQCDNNVPYPTKLCKLALLGKPCQPAPLFNALPILAAKEAKRGKKKIKKKNR